MGPEKHWVGAAAVLAEEAKLTKRSWSYLAESTSSNYFNYFEVFSMKLHFLHQLCKWFSYKLKKVKLTFYASNLVTDKNLNDWNIALSYTFLKKKFTF